MLLIILCDFSLKYLYTKQKAHSKVGFVLSLAEDMRFELTVAFTTPPFQDGALNRSANPPVLVYYTQSLNSLKEDKSIIDIRLDCCLCYSVSNIETRLTNSSSLKIVIS